MKKNVGSLDRGLRALAAILLLVLNVSIPLTGVVGILSLVIAAILLLTALTGFCPLYVPFKISTVKKSNP